MSTVYRYVGEGRYVMGLPARDLMPEDLAEVLAREGIGVDVVEGCGLYVAERVEVEPFCGAALAQEALTPPAEAAGSPLPLRRGAGEGGKTFGEGLCRKTVEEWGERCAEHREE